MTAGSWQIRYRIRDLDRQDIVITSADQAGARQNFDAVIRFRNIDFVKLLSPEGEILAYHRPD